MNGNSASRIALWTAFLAMVVVAAALDVQARIKRESAPFIQADPPRRYTAIVLGCRVMGDDVSRCLEERLQRALDLYHAGRVQRLLLSGDHGHRGYDEVNTMKDWLRARGVPLEVIFLDHAGFDTYDSMVRAHQVFQVKDALVVSQAFHLPRAIYLARRVGIDAIGVAADPPGGSSCRGSAVREPLACLKAWYNTTVRSAPHFLGPAIPITGSPAATFDRAERVPR